MEAHSSSPLKLVALDTNILFHLAEQYPPAHNLVLRLVRRGFTPIVTQTVVQELAYFVDFSGDAKRAKTAETALCTMRQWGIQPWILKPVGNGICEVIADVIAARKILPEHERNDAFIVIEAGFAGGCMLATWDRHLLDASNAALNEVLASFDLHPVQITDPKTILGH